VNGNEGIEPSAAAPYNRLHWALS